MPRAIWSGSISFGLVNIPILTLTGSGITLNLNWSGGWGGEFGNPSVDLDKSFPAQVQNTITGTPTSGTSTSTATRDLQDLVVKGLTEPLAAKGRSHSYRVALERFETGTAMG